MIGIVDVVDTDGLDVFEESLLMPLAGSNSDSIVFEPRDGNEVIRAEGHSIRVSANDKPVATMSNLKFQVFITDARVAFACSKYDKGGGWVGLGSAVLAVNAVSHARAAMRRRGKMLVGQLRYPWLAQVGATYKTGMLTGESLSFECEQTRGESITVSLGLHKRTDAAELAAEITRRAARYVLATDADLSDKVRDALRERAGATRIPFDPSHSKFQLQYHRLPHAWPIADEQAARLVATAIASG